MTNEVRTYLEGSLRWAVASGTGATWVTAAAAPTGLVGYVEVGLSISQTQNKALVKDRGMPSHWKNIGEEASTVKFKVLQGNTAQYPPTSVTAAGASLPLVHFELRYNMPELGGPTAQFYQFCYGVIGPNVITEGEQGNSMDQTWSFIKTLGPVLTGYLSTGNGA